MSGASTASEMFELQLRLTDAIILHTKDHNDRNEYCSTAVPG